MCSNKVWFNLLQVRQLDFPLLAYGAFTYSILDCVYLLKIHQRLVEKSSVRFNVNYNYNISIKTRNNVFIDIIDRM